MIKLNPPAHQLSLCSWTPQSFVASCLMMPLCIPWSRECTCSSLCWTHVYETRLMLYPLPGNMKIAFTWAFISHNCHPLPELSLCHFIQNSRNLFIEAGDSVSSCLEIVLLGHWFVGLCTVPGAFKLLLWAWSQFSQPLALRTLVIYWNPFPSCPHVCEEVWSSLLKSWCL